MGVLRKALPPAFAVALVLLAAFWFPRSLSAPEEEPITQVVEGCLAYVSVSDLFKEATLIAEGTVSGHTDGFQIESVSGSVANFTDYHFKISSLLRGDIDGETLDIRTKGGTVGNYTEVYTGSPEWTDGEEYLVFLYQPGRGGSFHTEGDYYYVLGLCQGVFSKGPDGQYVSQAGEELSGETLVLLADDGPVDPLYFRNQYIENQKGNLENGFLTQEEFDLLMQNIDKYAVILD